MQLNTQAMYDAGTDPQESVLWPEPDLSIVDGNLRQPPVLLLEPFGSWADWIEATAKSCSAPKDYVIGGLLAGAASLIGNARWVSPWAGWQEPSILWLSLIGNPSSGKSPALECVLSLVRDLESLTSFRGRISRDQRIWRVGTSVNRPSTSPKTGTSRSVTASSVKPIH